MPRVLLSAYIGSFNLGDEAIAHVIIKRLASTPGLDTTVLTKDLDKTRRVADGIDVAPAKMLHFVRQMRRADALLLGGGGIIQDQSSFLNLFYYYLQSWIAKRIHHKPVYLIFVGVGPIKSRLAKFYFRRMMRLLDHAVVRDDYSRDTLVGGGMSAEAITVAYDIAFNLALDPQDDARSLVDTDGRYLVFCPRDWFFQKTFLPARFALKWARARSGSPMFRYRHFLLKLVTKTLEEDPKITLVGVPFFLTQDLDLLEWIRERLPAGARERFAVVAAEVSPSEFAAIAAGSELTIGMRLHAVILAASAGSRIAPLAYSSKVASLTEYLGVADVTTHLKGPEPDMDEAHARIVAALGKKRPTASLLAKLRDKNDEVFDAFMGKVLDAASK